MEVCNRAFAGWGKVGQETQEMVIDDLTGFFGCIYTAGLEAQIRFSDYIRFF